MTEDFFSSLKFASSETREKPKKDTLKTARNKLKTALENQKTKVKDLIKDPSKEMSGRDVRMFHESGDHWRVQIRHGRRVINLTGDKNKDDIIAKDLNEVVSILDGIIRLVVAKDRRVDAALEQLEKERLEKQEQKNSKEKSAAPIKVEPKPTAKRTPA